MKQKTFQTVLALLTAISLLLCTACSLAESTAPTADDWPKDQPKAVPLTTDQVITLARLALGMDEKGENDAQWVTKQVAKFLQNPAQYNEDSWDGIFGTWADGISLPGDPVNDGRVIFVMELPAPVAMPETYSVSYTRRNKEEQEVTTTLERDADGNIHYIDGDTEEVFVRKDGKYRRYAVAADGNSFGKWDGVTLSARSVRQMTSAFWDCADQTFIKWLGMTFVEATEYLGRPCSLCHAEPGTITFSYQGDMIMDDETGICLSYTADELMRGPIYTITEDKKIEIDIGQYDIGGDEMNFSCTRFESENISFPVPAE